MGQIWKSTTTDAGSYLITFPSQYFQVGTRDFTVQYYLKPVYPGDGSPSVANYTFFQMYDYVDPTWGMALSFGFMPSYGDKFIGAAVNYHALDTKWASQTGFAISGLQLILTVTCDRDGLMKFYVNGALVDSEDISLFNGVAFTPNLVQFNHGGNPSCQPDNAHELDQLRVYIGKALSQSEISAIAGRVVNKTNFAALVDDGLFTEFDDPSPGTLASPKGSALVGGVWTDNIASTLTDYGLPGLMGYAEGGVPFASNIQEALCSAILADTVLAGFTGSRFYLGEAPQKAALPYIVYEQPQTEFFKTLQGTISLQKPVFQFSIYAASVNEVITISEVLQSRLNSLRGLYGNIKIERARPIDEVDIKDLESNETLKRRGRRLDYEIWYRES